MPIKKDLIGQKFGRLKVLSEGGKHRSGSILWNCHCDCGNNKIVSSKHLKHGNTNSCGCLKLEIITARKLPYRKSAYQKVIKRPKQKCAVAECERQAKTRNFCNTHYERFRKHGSPNHLTSNDQRMAHINTAKRLNAEYNYFLAETEKEDAA